VPAREACIIDPMWDQFIALLPPHEDTHPLGGHRLRVADRVVFDTLVQVLVFGCAYARIAAKTCSATTVRRRRDAWIAAGVMATLHTLVLAVDDRMIGRELRSAVDGCMTTAPCGGEVAGRSPVNRGNQGRTRSLVVDATGIPLGSIAAPASQPDSPLLEATLDTLARRGPRIRFCPDPSTLGRTRAAGRDCRPWDPGTLHGGSALGGGAHACLDPWLQETGLMHGTAGCGGGVLARLGRSHHHRPSAHPRRVDPLPLGGTTISETVIEHPIGAGSKAG